MSSTTKTGKSARSKSKRSHSPEEVRYCSIRELSEDSTFGFTAPMIRYYILQAESNGLSSAIRRIGRKILIRRDLFLKWIEESTEKPSKVLPNPKAGKVVPREKKSKTINHSFDQEMVKMMVRVENQVKKQEDNHRVTKNKLSQIEERLVVLSEEYRDVLITFKNQIKPCACSEGLRSVNSQVSYLGAQLKTMADVVRLLFENIPGLKVSGFNVLTDGTVVE